jgi:hypothetical protein
MLIGYSLEFRKDGTGHLKEWGFDHLHHEPEIAHDPIFQWKMVGPQEIEITYEGSKQEVSYDFKDVGNEYGISELQMHHLEGQPDERGEIGFWRYPYSLIYRPKEGLLQTVLRMFLG